MELNDLLAKDGIILIRRFLSCATAQRSASFRKVLPWLAAERPYEPITDASGAVIGAYFLGSNKYLREGGHC